MTLAKKKAGTRESFTLDGLDSFIRALEQLEADTTEILKGALYVGADVMADTVKAELRALPVDERWGTPENPTNGIKQKQKNGLIDSFGVAPMEIKAGGVIDTVLGFDGYNDIKTKKHPGGQPNQLIARSLESGTSFSRKIPFMARAKRKGKAAAETAMENYLEAKIKELTKE